MKTNSVLKNYRLEWQDRNGEWKTQIQNEDILFFNSAVRSLVLTSKREGDWMQWSKWRIAEYELREVSTTEFIYGQTPVIDFL